MRGHVVLRRALTQRIPQSLYQIYAFNQFQRSRWVAQQAAKIDSGSRVLDVGSGSCPYRALFAHCRYETQDFSTLSPDQLWGKAGYGHIDYLSDILAIPVPNASFDVLICTEVLEHVPEPIAAVHEFARILKPQGKLILTAPLGSGLHQEPYHYYGGYTPYWYTKFLTEAGFVEITIEPNGGFFKHYGQESLRFAEMIAPWRGKTQLLLVPLWALLLPWLLIVPWGCSWLDRLDHAHGFTVGYHVTAVRG